LPVTKEDRKRKVTSFGATPTGRWICKVKELGLLVGGQAYEIHKDWDTMQLKAKRKVQML
jgi:hypothetical protein